MPQGKIAASAHMFRCWKAYCAAAEQQQLELEQPQSLSRASIYHDDDEIESYIAAQVAQQPEGDSASTKKNTVHKSAFLYWNLCPHMSI